MTKPKFKKHDKLYLLKLIDQMDRDKIPPILKPLWQPRRKKMVHGGRGSAKTQTACRIIIRQASNYKMRVLWAREVLESIKESLWSELSILIPKLGYPGWDIKEEFIRNKKTGSRFVFKGLRDIKAARSMKGYSHFDRLIVDEAEAVPKDSWTMAVPTIREPGSEVWAIFNRYDDLDPVYELYCLNYNPSTTMVIECNWRDNPWFPEELRLEMEEMKEADYDLYLHVWENQPIAQKEFAVMDRVLVDIAMKTILPPDGQQVIGVDVARFGGDKTKVYERRGVKCIKLFERKHEKPIITAREIAHKADHKWITINIDNGGLGAGGMIDQLEEWGFKNVNGINFGGDAKKKKVYGNCVTEMYFECKDKLIHADIPNDPVLKQDLTGRLYNYDLKQRKILEKKKEFRDRYHRSPDDGDGFVLCWYDPGKKIKMSGDEKKKMQDLVKKRIQKNRERFII